MFALYISLLPEFFLLFGAGIILFVAHFRSSNTPKTYFTLAKFFVGMSLLSTVVFYNQSVEPHWFRNSSYTTLFKVLIYLAALAAFYLGCKWFLNKNRSSMGYYLAKDADGIDLDEILGIANEGMYRNKKTKKMFRVEQAEI